MAVTGVVLAAGAGTRMGRPKALLRTPSGEPWVAVACRLMLDAGCDRVVVVLGASAPEAALLIPADARVDSVVNPDWEDGMSSSLRAGLAASSGDGALVTVVDMPALPGAVAARVLERGLGTPVGDGRAPAAATAEPTRSLVRAVFGGRPGHPVFIGNAHWAPLSATLTGDRGARGYLDAHGVAEVECGDLYDGHDVDVPGAEAR